jgi:hypothetical protein
MAMRLLTAPQLAHELGLPSARTVRTMQSQGLPGVKLGKAWHYDLADAEAFIQNRKETTCPAQREGLTSNGIKTAEGGTSSTAKVAGRESAAQAQAIAARLIGSSTSSDSAGASQRSQSGQVIRAAFR